MLGATAVWIGTRFVLCEEANAPKAHQEAVRTAGFDDSVRTIIFTGRPLRVRNNEYIRNWEENRQAEIKELTEKGTIPVESDFEKLGDDMTDEVRWKLLPLSLLSAKSNDSLDDGQRSTLPNGQGCCCGKREEERSGDC